MQKLTAEDSELMVWEDHEDFEPNPVHSEIVGKDRWTVHMFQVFRRNDGTFWAVSWNKAATEMQEHEIEDPPFEVEAREVTVTKWVKK